MYFTHRVILVSESSNGSHAADTCVNSRWHTTSRVIKATSGEIQFVKLVVDLLADLRCFVRHDNVNVILFVVIPYMYPLYCTSLSHIKMLSRIAVTIFNKRNITFV